jgi:phage shock protein A
MWMRIANLFKGFLSLFITGLEKSNPEALLELERENLREQVAKYNDGLASHAGLCERLMSQIRQLEAEERDLRGKAAAHLRAGNRDAAGQYALRLQTVQRELEENRAQLEQAEATYRNLLKARDVAIGAARAKIENLRSAINDLKMKQALAELTEMSAGMVTTIGGAGETLDRLSQMVSEERDKAAGRVRLARDTMDMSTIQLKDAEQKALAEQALADFAAREGIAVGDSAAPPVEKTMGASREAD